MPKNVIHAFIYLRDGVAVVLPLRGDLTIHATVVLNSKKRVSIALNVSRDRPARYQANDLGVASLTVIYGANGGGKTQLLINIGQSLGGNLKSMSVGVLWQRDEQFFFDPGLASLGFRSVGELPVENASLNDSDLAVGATFYTTSPFEKVRRGALRSGDTVDVSPTFEQDNPFSGVALFRAAGALPRGLDFTKNTKVGLQVAIPNLGDLLAEGLDALSPPKDKSRASDLINKEAAVLGGLSKALSTSLRHALVIALYQAKMTGPRYLAEFVIDLMKILRNAKPREAVRRLLEVDGHLKSVEPSAIDIERALSNVLRRGLSVGSVANSFAQCEEVVSGWESYDVDVLRAAERLGLITWTFSNLSSGQVALLMLFASVARGLATLAARGAKNAVVLVDEGEMFMHPAWQRKYLQDLTSFLSKTFGSDFEEIHLMLSTHSLIVAGDAPPYRLFDVQRGEIENGFAAGPGELLQTVYRVPEFAGQLSEALYTQIGDFLRRGGDEKKAATVKALVDQIAPNELRAYLQDELLRRSANA